MRIVGNFDSAGKLERLHCNPVEECNLDDATNVRTLSILGAFMEWERSSVGTIEVICQHCDFAEKDQKYMGERDGPQE